MLETQCLLRISGPCPGYERPQYRSWWPALPGRPQTNDTFLMRTACTRAQHGWQKTCGHLASVQLRLSTLAPTQKRREHVQTPVAAAELLSSPVGEPSVAAADQSMTPLNGLILNEISSQVSAHVCQGGEDEPVQSRAEERTCMFKNICYDRNANQWLYFRNPDLAPPPTFTHVGTRNSETSLVDPHVQTEFHEAVVTSSGFNEALRVKVLDRMIPGNVAWISGLSYHRQPLGPWANAIGHMYAEYLYAIYHAMDVFGLVTRNISVLMRDTPCNTNNPADRNKRGNKCAHFHTLMRGLSDQYQELSTVLKPNFPPKVTARHVCYRSLLAGDGTLHGSSRRHAPESWGKFMHYWLAGLGINPQARPQKQRIIFVNKGGTAAGGAHKGGANRVALNAQSVMKTLAETFDVPIDSWVWNGETLEQEVAMLQRYSICITVCGGTAFSCTQLPDGASNIYMAVWSSEAETGRPGNNNNMETVTWTWDNRHKHYAYPVWLNETTPDTTIPRDPQYQYGMRWKHNRGFEVHTGRLAVLLNDALSQAQWRMFGGDQASGDFRRLTRTKLKELNGAGPSGVV